MANLTEVAKQKRISDYEPILLQKLSSKIIDTSKPEFSDLVNDSGRPMSTLNGDILLEKDIRDGRLMGVYSIHPDELAARLPDIKADPVGTGHKKYLDRWQAEGINILAEIADPKPNEYVVA